MPDTDIHVIVGAGLAGAKAAEALREEGFEGLIALIGLEAERPYERPPLSKDYLRGEFPRDKVYVHPESFYTRQWHRAAHATGAEPRRLRIPGAELGGVLYLRDLGDSDVIAERLRRGSKVAVIGAGWIGAEVAASARQKGLEVTIIERASVALERVLGPEVGAVYGDIHRDHGVELLTGTGLEAFEGDGAVGRVRLSDGRVIDCDFVVVGIGVSPRTALAEAAGLEVDNGVLVSETLDTSVPGVFAAGDVANASHPFYGHRVRVEHWANALNEGTAGAAAVLSLEPLRPTASRSST